MVNQLKAILATVFPSAAAEQISTAVESGGGSPSNIVILEPTDPDPNPVVNGVLYLRLTASSGGGGGDVPLDTASIRAVGDITASTATTTINIVSPSTAQIGDLLILAVVTGTDTTITTPPGWTFAVSGLSGTTAICELHVYTKIAESGDIGSTVSLSHTPTTLKRVAGVVVAAKGIWDGNSPVVTYDTSGNTRPLPSMTTTGNSLPILFICDRASGANPPNDAVPSEWTLPAGWTIIKQALTDIDSGSGVSLAVARAAVTDGAQATPTGNAISSKVNVRGCSVVVAVEGA